MSQSLKKKTIYGVVWSSIERISVQGVQLVVILVIARILDPKDFGLIGMLTIFLSVAQTLIDSGFSQALIRKQNRSDIDNSTVFYFNIVVSAIIYFIFFIIAPWVAKFYEEPLLTRLMRVLCLVIIINSFAVVQRAIFTASVDFKTQARASFIAAFVSGALGVYLAYSGLGVWALVWQQLSNALIITILLWCFSNWLPRLAFSKASFVSLFSFGSKLLAAGLINTIYDNLHAIVIGKVFNASSLGCYTQADRISKLPSSNISDIIQRVTYPVFCNIQDEDDRLRDNFRKILKVSALLVFPMMSALAGLSSPLITVLIGEKWHFASQILIPLCFVLMWYPVFALNLNILQVKGRSDLFLKLEFYKKGLGITALCVSIPFGVLIMCYANLISTLICFYINTYYTRKILKVGLKEQLQDLSGILIASIGMFILVMGILSVIELPIYQLLIGIAVCCVYISAYAFMFHHDKVLFVKSLVKNGKIK